MRIRRRIAAAGLSAAAVAAASIEYFPPIDR